MYILFPRFRLRVSVLAIPALMIMLWLEGAIPFAIMFFSASAHEIGHIAMMRYLGYRIRRIDVLPMGALIVCPEGIPDRDEALIALSGPIVSLFCAFVCSLWFMNSASAIPLFATLLNLIFGIVNLLPIAKLDGGKALYCILAYKQKKSAEQICSAVSLCSKILFFSLSVLLIILSDFNFGVILLSGALLVQII